jgi:hypothetical protein
MNDWLQQGRPGGTEYKRRMGFDSLKICTFRESENKFFDMLEETKKIDRH